MIFFWKIEKKLEIFSFLLEEGFQLEERERGGKGGLIGARDKHT